MAGNYTPFMTEGKGSIIFHWYDISLYYIKSVHFRAGSSVHLKGTTFYQYNIATVQNFIGATFSSVQHFYRYNIYLYNIS